MVHNSIKMVSVEWWCVVLSTSGVLCCVVKLSGDWSAMRHGLYTYAGYSWVQLSGDETASETVHEVCPRSHPESGQAKHDLPTGARATSGERKTQMLKYRHA